MDPEALTDWWRKGRRRARFSTGNTSTSTITGAAVGADDEPTKFRKIREDK
jgi:hypothetical protein